MWFWNDNPAMFRRVVAFSLVVLWLGLFGFESLEDIHLANYPTSPDSVRATLASFRDAINIANDADTKPSKTSADLSSFTNLFIEGALLSQLKEKSELPKGHVRIHKLHSVFLL